MDIKFEEALAGLEKCVTDMKKDSASLDELIKSYEEGVAYYNACERLLDEARHKIRVQTAAKRRETGGIDVEGI
jgi:exodeoxyribonuclease VII small subunit